MLFKQSLDLIIDISEIKQNGKTYVGSLYIGYHRVPRDNASLITNRSLLYYLKNMKKVIYIYIYIQSYLTII